MATTATRRRAGDIRTWNRQACIWGTSYRLVQALGAGKWLVERLAPSAAVVDAVIDYYAGAETGQTDACLPPIWDRTWAECGPGEHPRRIGQQAPADAMMAEIDRLTELAGTTMTVQFTSAAKYAEMF
jgi:hypothetical protein